MSNSNNFKFPKGSEWRKWDLHVHTRADETNTGYHCLGEHSLDDDQLGQLIEATGLSRADIVSREKQITAAEYAKLFVQYIGLFTDISVVAITNHNSGSEIDEIISESGNSQKLLRILPGVEVASTQGIHMLCIFDPEKPIRGTWMEGIDHFLTESGITGDRFDNGQPLSSSKSAQEIMQITHNKGGLCIFAHVGTNNGLFFRTSTATSGNAHSGIYTDKLCNILQIPSSGTLRSGVTNIISGLDPHYGNKKAVRVKCSDAKKLTDIGSSYTWIKSNPTFTGLQQITYEPDLRTSLVDDFRSKKPYFLIDKVRFLDNTGELNFTSDSIPINNDLNAIVGGKSTGKSLLLYYIARTIDVNEVNERAKAFSTPSSYRFHEDTNFDFEVVWADGIKHLLSSSNKKEDSETMRKILYIPQGYLNRLSEKNIRSKRTLNQFVLNVLLQDDELRKQNESLKKSIAHVVSDLAAKIDSIFALRTEVSSVSEDIKQVGDLEGIQKYIATIESEINDIKAKSGLSAEESAKYDELSLAHKNLSEANTNLTNDTTTIENLKDTLNRGMSVLTNAIDECIEDIVDNAIQVETEKRLSFVKQLPTNIDEAIEAIEGSLQKAIKANKKALGEVQAELTPLAAKLTMQEKLKSKTTELAKERTKETLVRSQSKSLKSKQEKLDKATKAVIAKYTNIVENYEVLQRECKTFEGRFEDLALNVTIGFNEEMFNSDVVNTFLKKPDLKKAVKGYSWKEEFDYKYDRDKHNVIIQQIATGLLDGSIRTLKSRDVKDALQKLLHDYYYLDFGITYKNDPLQRMSPGKKGLVLLKLLIDLSDEEWPVLLDQPEDDLDNRSVYYDLVTFLKRRKSQRQIIVVTHNPNLVIGADSDEVIVANQDGQDLGRDNRKFKFEYVSDALENSFNKNKAEEPHILYQKGIREHVCEVLEGGQEAFQKRERKYNFPH